jgi:hypothetical protein
LRFPCGGERSGDRLFVPIHDLRHADAGALGDVDSVDEDAGSVVGRLPFKEQHS